MHNINVYLRLLNARRFAAGMKQAGGSLANFRREVDATNTIGGKLRATSNLMTGGMYAAAAGARFAAASFGILTAAVVAVGVNFNATMESNQLAFEHFAGSAQQSAKLTQDLFKIARDTPFSFTDITTAARKFLAFGFTVKETTSLLDTLGDTLSYTGGGPLEIQRITKAFGDIRAKGRLMQQELNQLTNVGVNPYEMMKKGGLDLTPDQLKNIGRAGIDAKTAITALQSGMEQTFGGGSKKYLNTFNGQWNKLKDSISQAAGAATGGTGGGGIFGSLKNGLKGINDFLPKVNKFFNTPGFQKAATTGFKAIGGAFVFVYQRGKELLNALAPMKPLWTNVLWPFLKGVGGSLIGAIVVAWKMFIGVLKVAANVLGWVGGLFWWAKGIFEVVGYAIGFIFGPGILGLLGKVRFLGPILELAIVPLKLMGIFFQSVGKFAIWLAGKAIGPLITAFPRIAGAVSSMVGRVGGFLGNLKGKFIGILQWFANLGPTFGKIAIKIGDKIFFGMKSRVEKLIGFFVALPGFVAGMGRSLKNWINKHTIFGNTIDIGVAKVKIPALAKGGMFSNYALVGEEGPELARHTSAGTIITPLRAHGGGAHKGARSEPAQEGARFATGSWRLVAPIMLDRRTLAEATFQYKQDRDSRS